MTLNAPLVGLIVAAAAAAVAAFRLGLFTPSPSHPTHPIHPSGPTGPTSGGGVACARETAFPLLVGALAVYSSWMLIGIFVSSATGLAGYGGGVPNANGAAATGPPLELVARTHLLVGLLSVPIAGAICWWARRAGGHPLDGSPARCAKVAGRALIWCLVVLPIVFAVGVVATEISRWLGRPVDKTAHTMLKLIADKSGEMWARVVLIVIAVVVAPVLEEIIYRALLQRSLMILTRSAWPAILLTSVLFTAMHAGVIPSGSFWPAASLIFSLSVFLGLLFARTGSVVTAIVVHGAFNAVSVLVALLSV